MTTITINPAAPGRATNYGKAHGAPQPCAHRPSTQYVIQTTAPDTLQYLSLIHI